MNFSNKICALLITALLLIHSSVFSQVTTFTYTGGMQTYTVPVGVTTIQIECWGAQGQAITDEQYDESTGGLGGYAIGELAVTPGEVLNVFVGGMGTEAVPGYNGGALGGFAVASDGDPGRGGSGGGGSDVRQGGLAFADRVIVAGGGGGGGRDYVNGWCQPCGTGGNGGDGGALIGDAGDDPFFDLGAFGLNPGSGGEGGTQIAGGAAGDGPEGPDGIAGTLGTGAPGVDGSYSTSSGGGGGGYYGGGSGAGANIGSGVASGGGGGGSSYIDGVVAGSTTPGVRAGDGEIVITVLCTGLEVEPVEESICEGDEIILDATSIGGGTITWDGGVTNGVAFVPPVGITTYTATSDDAEDCEFAIDIEVNIMPEVTISVDAEEICEGETVTFTEGGDADTYVWDPVDIISGAPYTPGGLGAATYTLTGTTGACESTSSIDITVYPSPTVTGTASPTEICQGESIVFTGAGADSYSWDGGVTNGVPFTPVGAGDIDFTVTGTTLFGCENTAIVTVTVNPNPLVDATATLTEVCFGESTTLSGTGADSYTWTGGIIDGMSFTPAAMGPTTYTVTGTNAFGCEATASIVITVIDCEPVVPDFIMPGHLCVGDCITIKDISTGVVEDWSWTFGGPFGGGIEPGTSTAQHPEICVIAAGTYTITLVATSQTGAVTTTSKDLIVYNNPILSASLDTIIDLGGTAELIAGTSSIGDFIWTPDNNIDCPECPITSASPEETEMFVVSLIDINGCKASDSVMVLVNFVEGVGVPTAFSPNGDGNNDVLFVKGYALASLSFVVYNRYGEEIFATTDQNIGWDGTFQNRDENPGVFTWVLHYEYLNGKRGSQKGNTTLIR